jgi:hypothetical protein
MDSSDKTEKKLESSLAEHSADDAMTNVVSQAWMRPQESSPSSKTTEPAVGLDAIKKLDSDLPLNRPGEDAKQVGSWDRSGGNNDFNNFVEEKPDGTVTLLDEKGPGCVYRMWMTGINNNPIQIYVDDEKIPRVNAHLRDLFDGKVEGFPKALVMNDRESSGGFASYVPIPFSKHLKIVSNRNGIGSFYYNIGLKHFDEQKQVDSFDPAQSKANDRIWKDDDAHLEPKNPTRVELQKGQTAELRSNAPGIREMVFNDLPEDPKFLRNAVLRVYYDGKPFPSVECPLGDMVASPFYWSNVNSRMFSMDPKNHQITLKWPLLAKDGVRVTLTNDGDEPLTCTYSDDEQEAPMTDDSKGYFHAQFRLKNPQAHDGQDLELLKREGSGNYVGTIESVEGTHGLGYLEGDERVFIDSDGKIPSFNGTGTEDYYNGGWYFNHGPFSTPTHGAPIRQDNGTLSMYRLHLSDSIPFQQHINFGIEHGTENDSAEKYGLVSMWYQPELKPIDSELGTPEEREFRGPVEKQVEKQDGMIDALDLKVADKSPNLDYAEQPLGNRWLNFDQFWIPKAQPGDHVSFNLPVAKSGNYQLLGQFTKASDYGQWRIKLDGKPLADLDLYDPDLNPSGDLRLSNQFLSAGTHRFEMDCIGTNPQSRGARYMGGLDYLWLKPVSQDSNIS